MTAARLRTSFLPPAFSEIGIPTGEAKQSQEITNLFSTLPTYEIFGLVFD